MTFDDLLYRADWVAFSGSRQPRQSSVRAMCEAVTKVCADAATLVGRAPGDEGSMDQQVAAALTACGRTPVEQWAPNRSAPALIGRSKVVASLIASRAGLLVAFPDKDLPLVKGGRYMLPAPIPQWVSLEPTSGTWSTVILAAGKGASVLLWHPFDAPPIGGWAWESVAPGWWYLRGITL